MMQEKSVDYFTKWLTAHQNVLLSSMFLKERGITHQYINFVTVPQKMYNKVYDMSILT